MIYINKTLGIYRGVAGVLRRLAEPKTEIAQEQHARSKVTSFTRAYYRGKERGVALIVTDVSSRLNQHSRENTLLICITHEIVDDAARITIDDETRIVVKSVVTTKAIDTNCPVAGLSKELDGTERFSLSKTNAVKHIQTLIKSFVKVVD
jgi:hypothetical protein